jgi:hypothetical protein
MTTIITLTLTRVSPYLFVQPTFNGTLFIDRIPPGSFPVTFTVSGGGTTAVATLNKTIPTGTNVYTLNTPNTVTTVLSPQDTIVGRLAITFNNVPGNVSNVAFRRDGSIYKTENITINGQCLHGSSLIQTKDGLKRIDEIKPGDIVISGDNLDQYVKVKDIFNCWLTLKHIDPENGQDHDAIVFEPGSLGDNQPSQRLIIDPGHPMCTQKEYIEKGYEALKPAGDFWEELKSDKIYTKKWTDYLIQEEPSRRYDLILEEPYNTYVANGIVIKSNYKHNVYKEFV